MSPLRQARSPPIADVVAVLVRRGQREPFLAVGDSIRPPFFASLASDAPCSSMKANGYTHSAGSPAARVAVAKWMSVEGRAPLTEMVRRILPLFRQERRCDECCCVVPARTRQTLSAFQCITISPCSHRLHYDRVPHIYSSLPRMS